MVFSILNKVVDGVKGGVTAGLKGTADIGSSIVGVVKDTTVNTLKETGEAVEHALDVPASIVKGAITGAGEIGETTVAALRGVVNGTVQGFSQSGSKDQDVAIQGSVAQALHSAKDLGLNIGDTAVESVRGVIDAVAQVGGDTAGATKTAIETTLSTATEIGTDAVVTVKEALVDSSIEGSKDIVNAATK